MTAIVVVLCIGAVAVAGVLIAGLADALAETAARRGR
jgi:hypothetical protein